MGIHLEFYGSSVGFCWEFICGSLELIGGHWRLLENCWGFIWSSMGAHSDFIWGNWRLLGNSLGLFEASWQFIFGSFRVHWGSLEVIGEMFGIHLEFNGTMGVHLDCDRDNWRLL